MESAIRSPVRAVFFWIGVAGMLGIPFIPLPAVPEEYTTTLRFAGFLVCFFYLFVVGPVLTAERKVLALEGELDLKDRIRGQLEASLSVDLSVEELEEHWISSDQELTIFDGSPIHSRRFPEGAIINVTNGSGNTITSVNASATYFSQDTEEVVSKGEGVWSRREGRGCFKLGSNAPVAIAPGHTRRLLIAKSYVTVVKEYPGWYAVGDDIEERYLLPRVLPTSKLFDSAVLENTTNIEDVFDVEASLPNPCKVLVAIRADGGIQTSVEVVLRWDEAGRGADLATAESQSDPHRSTEHPRRSQPSQE